MVETGVPIVLYGLYASVFLAVVCALSGAAGLWAAQPKRMLLKHRLDPRRETAPGAVRASVRVSRGRKAPAGIGIVRQFESLLRQGGVTRPPGQAGALIAGLAGIGAAAAAVLLVAPGRYGAAATAAPGAAFVVIAGSVWI
ncbi:MAG: hypothetical protein D6826_08750, partial [Alphaproteobacteria bacterium]